jgi:hypothetical protein
VSNAGEVLFIGWEHEGVPNIESAESWSIYKVINGKAEFLTHGFMPKWLNNEEFIFLRNDGLYVANKDMSAMRKIGESDQSPVLSNNRFDISDDGTKLVWSKPYLAQVVVYSMQSDASLVLGKTINAKAFWTLFSPSSNYLIIQTIDRNAKGDEDNPQSGVEFYDMKTFQKITEVEINFEAFNQMYMFISDWVAK